MQRHQTLGRLQRGDQMGRTNRNRNAAQPDGAEGRLQPARIGVRQAEAFQTDARAWQVVARVQPQWLRVARLAPFDQDGKGEIGSVLQVLAILKEIKLEGYYRVL